MKLRKLLAGAVAGFLAAVWLSQGHDDRPYLAPEHRAALDVGNGFWEPV